MRRRLGTSARISFFDGLGIDPVPYAGLSAALRRPVRPTTRWRDDHGRVLHYSPRRQQATIRWNGRSAGVPAASKVWMPTRPAWSFTVIRPGGAVDASVVPSVALNEQALTDWANPTLYVPIPASRPPLVALPRTKLPPLVTVAK
jgi:hypothetical protein